MGDFWDARWQQTNQVNFNCLCSSEHAHFTKNNGIYLVSLQHQASQKSPFDLLYISDGHLLFEFMTSQCYYLIWSQVTELLKVLIFTNECRMSPLTVFCFFLQKHNIRKVGSRRESMISLIKEKLIKWNSLMEK